MKDGPAHSARSAAQWLNAVKAFEREGEFFKAYDLAAQGLSAHREDIPLKHRAVLCLARAGATDLAQLKYCEFGLDTAATDRARPPTAAARRRPRWAPIPLEAPRGYILDRQGKRIAENVPGYAIKLLASNEDSLRAVLGRLDALAALVRGAWSGYDVTAGTRAVMDFCDNDLSNWYVRVNRARFWAPDARADRAALATLYEALVAATRLLAPAAPFLSDAIHRRLVGTSVHLAPFPEDRGRRDDALDRAMAAVRTLASLARAARDAASRRVRQPLAAMRVAVPAAVDAAALERLLPLLAEEVNVKRIDRVASDEELVRLTAKPNFAALGKVYGRRTPAAAEAARTLAPDLLRRLEAGEPVEVERDGQRFAFRPEDVVVGREVKGDWLVQSGGGCVVALDPGLTAALQHEGLAREVVNRIQRLRKEAGYDYATRIVVSISGAAEVMEAVRAHAGFIAGETLARRFEIAADLPRADLSQQVAIDGREVKLSVRRHDRPGDGEPRGE